MDTNKMRDLKALAETCLQHQPLRFMRSHGALYIRNANGIVFDVHQNRSFPDFISQNKDYADLALACTPPTILALLAEIERLAKFEDWFIRLDQVEQSLAASYKAERDQLKAENEALRKDALRYRWLRQASATDGEYTHGVCIDLWESGCGFEGTLEEADAAVDTAMAKEANRD